MAFRLLLVVVLSSFALIPLTTEHFFASSDGLYHIYRAIEVNRCLESGVLICRWMPDQFLGYGTPLLNLYSPAVYYIIALFHQLGPATRIARPSSGPRATLCALASSQLAQPRRSLPPVPR